MPESPPDSHPIRFAPAPRPGYRGGAPRPRWSVARTLVALLAAGLCACNQPPAPSAPFVVTIPPLKLILQEIVGDETQVVCILPPGSSPHSFELRPSVARQLAEARAVFFVDGSIDGWAAQSASGKLHAVFPMVPEAYQLAYDIGSGHDHDSDASPLNAHFWSDPVAVRAIIPDLVTALSKLEPARAAQFQANGAAFMKTLADLHDEIGAGKPDSDAYSLAAFHPSWQYFCHRYGIRVTAYIEPFPGKEPTPRALQALQMALGESPHRIILSEVQLSAKPAEVLAESLGASVTKIDPLGGEGERATYSGLLRYNAALLWDALP